ncbi:MAG: ribonuclease [Proteobacteria bacterium]|nr:ribonuclease [Pseudomonadota bacterium]
MNPRKSVFAVLLMVLALPASAQVPEQGTFVAAKSCPAVVSIKKGSNPGNASVRPGQSYALVGKNKDEASHYWIEVPGAEPSRRWVAVDCGGINGEAPQEQQAGSPPAVPAPSTDAFYILAITWQPAFCEQHPGKAECRSQTSDRYDASHFTLHGLWPQPRDNVFCDVSAADQAASEGGNWKAIAPLPLTAATHAELEKVMPGAQSGLERHEWIKHGSCYPGRTPERYFADALRLMNEINSSAAARLMAANPGKTVTSKALRAAFDESFGAGAGDRIRVACKDDGKRRLIVELTLGLRGDIPAGTSLSDLLMASRPTDPGCPSGVVDRVGLQ